MDKIGIEASWGGDKEAIMGGQDECRYREEKGLVRVKGGH